MGFVVAAIAVALVAGMVGAGAVLYAELRSGLQPALSARLVLCALQGWIGLGGVGLIGAYEGLLVLDQAAAAGQQTYDMALAVKRIGLSGLIGWSPFGLGLLVWLVRELYRESESPILPSLMVSAGSYCFALIALVAFGSGFS
jgi:hypothetical protein